MTDALASVDVESTSDLQHAALTLALALGCTGEMLARYCGASRSAVCRWLGSGRRMPAPLLARVLALLPWLVVHLRFQMVACRDARVTTIAALEMTWAKTKPASAGSST